MKMYTSFSQIKMYTFQSIGSNEIQRSLILGLALKSVYFCEKKEQCTSSSENEYTILEKITADLFTGYEREGD